MNEHPTHFNQTRKKSLALVLASACAGLVTAGAIAAGISIKDGAYTADQALRGKAVYEKSCKNCHQADFYRERLARYKNRSVGALFQTVSTTMPADNVGGLATSEYLDVLAYVLQITGSPAGSSELSEDNMDDVRIVESN